MSLLQFDAPGEVVMLHRVTAQSVEPGPYAQISIHPDSLDEKLDRCAFLPADFWSKPKLPPDQPGPWTSLTFDDGYKDNLHEALPILEKHSAPAIVFVTVAPIEGDFELYGGVSARIIAESAAPTIRGKKLEIESASDLNRACESAYYGLERGRFKGRRQRLQRLARENGFAQPPIRKDLFLDWSELRELARHPLITIGAHSWTHPRLNRTVPWELFKELGGAKRHLEQMLRRPISTVAYPHGGNNSLVRWATRQAGYYYAFTTAAHRISPQSPVQRFAIPRTAWH